MDKTQADLDLYFLTRNVQWRYRLDQYEDAVIADMLKTVRAAVSDVQKQLFMGEDVPRADVLVQELEALSAGLRRRLGEDVADMATEALNYSAVEHQAILSINGAASINTVALSAEQFRAFMASPATGGVSLPAWVDAAWGNAVTEQVKRNLNIAVLQGESYQKAVRGLLESSIADFTEREAVTIARTYIQTANVAAQMAVYEANDDLVTGWRWSAVLEGGYSKSGRGTCLVCAARDGREYPLRGGPSIPAHPRCRCTAISVLKTWRELGIDRDELEPAIRPYTIRPDANIDAGGMRTIIESGRHQGDYASWWAKQPEAFKINAVGPGRYELIKSGKIQFADLVDGDGRQRTLKELMGGARVSPTMTIAEAETWAAKSKIKETLYHGTQNKSEILKGGFSLDAPVKNGRINGDGVYFAHQVEDAQGWGGDVVRVKVNVTNPATYDEINKGTALPGSFRGVEMDSKYAKNGGVYSNWDWIEEVGKEYFPDDISSVRMAKVFKEIGIDAIIDPRTHAGTVVFDVSKIKIIKD